MVSQWLLKSEPTSYSIDDLKRDHTTFWEGVRNFQARNMMRDEMQKGDLAFFYHSNAKPSGIAGICRICEIAYPDPTSWDPKSRYYDPKSSLGDPRWVRVDVEFVEKFPHFIALEELRKNQKLQELRMLQPGSRLSVTPVQKELFQIICKMGHAKLD